MVEQLEPAKQPSGLVLETLRKLERPRCVLVRVNNRTGVLMTTNRRGQFQVEKVPTTRIVHMVERGFVLEMRRSAFSQLGWLEYDLTYDGVKWIRDNHA